jgi:hypothetical protein
VLGLGPSVTLLKEQGYYNLVQNGGHKGPVLRPRCIGPKEGPCPNYDSILFNTTSAYLIRIVTYSTTVTLMKFLSHEM